LKRLLYEEDSWVDDDVLPELSSDADMGVMIDQANSGRIAVSQLGLLMAGIWVEIFAADQQCWQTRRLSWISPANGQHFFMDEQGLVVAVFSLEEVTAWIDDGLLRMIEPMRLQLSG